MSSNDKEELEFLLWQFFQKAKKLPEIDIPEYIKHVAERLIGKMGDVWLTEAEVVRWYPFKREWLRNSRKQGKGPPFHKTSNHRNGKVLYLKKDLDRYLRGMRSNPNEGNILI